jgi:hypothetical protein
MGGNTVIGLRSTYLWLRLIRQPLRVAVRLIIIALELPPLGRPLGHPLHQVLGRVERPTSLHATLGAPLRLAVVVQRTLLTEVVLALGAHRIDKLLAADGALVRQVVLLRDDVLVLVGGGVVARLELLVHLPAMLVVAAVVHEFAGVAEAAVSGLFVVLGKIIKIKDSVLKENAQLSKRVTVLKIYRTE